MDHRTRIERVINREKTDHPPIAFWRHFPVDDQNALSLAKSTLAFQNQFDLDLVKISPSSSFCLEDWGAIDVWRGNPEGTRDYLTPVIVNPEDWNNLKILDPNKGRLGEQLECLKIIKRNLNSDTPFIQTIFSPLAQAKNLVGKNNLQNFIRKHPDQLMAGLEVITQSTMRFIEECGHIGIDGIFYALQFASYDLVSEKEFLSFEKYFDKKLFAILENFWLNLLHVHGKNIMFDSVRDYPFQIINWHDQETEPNLRSGKNKTDHAVCGGVGRIETMVLGDAPQIIHEIDCAIDQTEGLGLIIGTGCVLPQTTPIGNIQSAVEHSRQTSI